MESDGKYIVFARSKAITQKSIRDKGGVLLTYEDCIDFINRKVFQIRFVQNPIQQW
jgi:hypothetical protein